MPTDIYAKDGTDSDMYEVEEIYAPDGYAYCKDTDDEIAKLIRKIEQKNAEECGVNFTRAPEVIFDF